MYTYEKLTAISWNEFPTNSLLTIESVAECSRCMTWKQPSLLIHTTGTDPDLRFLIKYGNYYSNNIYNNLGMFLNEPLILSTFKEHSAGAITMHSAFLKINA